ncbi:MAG: hypothetical protein PVG65_02690 [Candidatus Thorarchaeota archaeon]|jgi:hypothetical protein
MKKVITICFVLVMILIASLANAGEVCKLPKGVHFFIVDPQGISGISYELQYVTILEEQLASKGQFKGKILVAFLATGLIIDCPIHGREELTTPKLIGIIPKEKLIDCKK